MKKRITKNERKLLGTILFSILAFAILSDPIKNIIDTTFVDSTFRIIIGLLLLGGILWFWKLK